MKDLKYDTPRLKCRSLTRTDFSEFAEIVTSDKMIQKFFRFGESYGEVMEFLYGLSPSDCIPVGVFLKSTNVLIGYINGYFYSPGTLLVEFFIAEGHRYNHYASEALNGFINSVSSYGLDEFRFDVETDNVASLALLGQFSAVHCIKEDFSSEAGNTKREFRVYKIFR